MMTPRTSSRIPETSPVDGSPVEIRQAVTNDHQEVLNLLRSAKLPTEDVAFGRMDFLVAVEGTTIVGTVGLEIIGDTALLRSLAVQSSRRSHGMGRRLCAAILQHARARRVRDVYLLTTDAVKFFEKIDFKILERNDLPIEIRQTTQFSGTTCSSATSMHLSVQQA